MIKDNLIDIPDFLASEGKDDFIDIPDFLMYEDIPDTPDLKIKEVKDLCIPLPSFLEDEKITKIERVEVLDKPEMICTKCQTSCESHSMCGTCQYCQRQCQTSCQTGCQVSCQTTCEKSSQSCTSSCQLYCQSTCQKSCQSTCQSSCQTSCQTSCQSTCEKSSQCTTNCEVGCMSGCQVSCQVGCQISCQNGQCNGYCESFCQGSATSCQTECQSSCQKGCLSCQNSCQTVCEVNGQGCSSYCERACQSSCQLGCQDTFELCGSSCQFSCESGCQYMCQTVCESWCQDSCQTGNCQANSCQTACQNCEGGCQKCQICESSCQDSCQANCEALCQLACELACQGGQTFPGGGSAGGTGGAKLVISNITMLNGGSFTATITGLSKPFDKSYYKTAVLTKTDAGNEATNVSNVIKTVTAGTSSNTYVTMEVTNVGYGTFDIYAYCQTNKYYKAGHQNITIHKTPSLWSWSASVQNAIDNHGEFSTLRTYEWNEFLDTIALFLKYKGMDKGVVTTAQQQENNLIKMGSNATTLSILMEAKSTSAKNTMTAEKFNTVRFVIGCMNSTGLTVMNKGDKVMGRYFNILKNSLNAIT